MITYQDNFNSTYYDFKTLTEILRVHPSYLKREIKKYGFTNTDYVRYNNRYLYSQNAVINFIVYLVKEKLTADLHRMEMADKKSIK